MFIKFNLFLESKKEINDKYYNFKSVYGNECIAIKDVKVYDKYVLRTEVISGKQYKSENVELKVAYNLNDKYIGDEKDGKFILLTPFSKSKYHWMEKFA